MQPRILCPGFGWDRVNFLHSSWYDAVLWTYDENNGDNTWMISVVAEQGLHRAKAFPAFHAALPVRRPGVDKVLRGDTARTGGPNRPKGCPILHGVMLSNKSWGKETGSRDNL